MFALVVRFDLHDDAAAAAFDALLAQTLPSIAQHEPGTLVYATHQLAGDPLARIFYEVYADREAHAAHEATPHTARFLAAISPHVDRSRVEFLSSPVGSGVPG